MAGLLTATVMFVSDSIPDKVREKKKIAESPADLDESDKRSV
jgi:hypothetical protein